MIDEIGAGMHALWVRQEMLANNLANVSTPGFKRDDLVLPPVWRPAVFPPLGFRPLPLAPLPWTDFSPGPLRETGRPLDVAVEGKGFLVVETPAGPRYTRAGALEVSAEGVLVVPGAGPVLGSRGPIPVRSAQVTISERGDVEDNGVPVDRLRVVEFEEPYPLRKEGSGLFAAVDPTAQPALVEGPVVRSGWLESSNVGAVQSMVSLIEVHRLWEAYARVIQAADETNARAVNDIGRV